ncbi:MAG: ComEC/Rec2 family competence protein [Anaerolineales bacterium]|nr:ComEC/Rec2 family competence protein [Anaerolineales bacterium]
MTLFYLCVFWMAGIGLAPILGLPFAAALTAGVSFFLLAFTLRRLRIAILGLAFFFLGSARLSAAQPKPGPGFVGAYLNASGVYEVVLEEDPIPKGGGFRIRARVERILPDGETEIRDLEGAVLVFFPRPPEGWRPRCGDRLVLYARLQPPPEIRGFDYALYLARQGVFGVLEDPVLRSSSPGSADPLRAALFAVRRRAQAVLRRLFPEPECALLAGILLGDESGIPLPVQDAFARTGTSHIVAISGFNISIIAGIFLALTKRLPRRIPGWLIAVLGIALYTVLVGAAASVVRAAVMGGMAMFGRSQGRRSHGLTSLAFAGAAMTAFSPWALWDIGFQLSFAAALGLILYADPLQNGAERLLRRLSKEKARALASAAGEIFLMTAAAQITTLPLMLYYFSSLSLSAFAVNPLILSVQPMVMIGGGLALMLGMVWLPAGQALAWAGWAPTAYTIRVVEWGADFSSLWLPTRHIPPSWIAVYYLALFGGTALSAFGKFPRPAWGKTIAAKACSLAVPVLAAGAYLAWGVFFNLPDGRLHLTVLATGGEAMLLRSPSGGTVLIDAGGDPNLLASGLGRILGYGPQRLDWVVVGSAAAESASALGEIGERYEIGGVLIPAGTDRNRKTLAGFLTACVERGIPVVEAGEGFGLDLGGGSRLRVLGQGEAGVILAVEYGAARWLILDGLDEELSGRMLTQGRVPAAQIAVFPYSVKKSGGLSEWLGAARPSAGIWPFEADLGWPEGTDLLRTDARGWIELATDGVRLWVRVEK